MVYVKKGNGRRLPRFSVRCWIRDTLQMLSHTMFLLMVVAKKVSFKKLSSC
jgi:hypothetical protein